MLVRLRDIVMILTIVSRFWPNSRAWVARPNASAQASPTRACSHVVLYREEPDGGLILAVVHGRSVHGLEL